MLEGEESGQRCQRQLLGPIYMTESSEEETWGGDRGKGGGEKGRKCELNQISCLLAVCLPF